jgi:hypothetical protein
MKKKTQKPLRSIYLFAAELVHASMIETPQGKLDNYDCKFSCVALTRAYDAARETDRNDRKHINKNTLEYKMFKRFFFGYKSGCGEYGTWWDFKDLPNNGWCYDYESRILALLLCAEMMRR